jgi:hypothetical protein
MLTLLAVGCAATTTTSAVLTPTVPVNADVPLQPNPVMKPQTQAAAVPAATPVTTAATNPNQVTVTQVAMPTASASDGPGPGSDCDSKSLYGVFHRVVCASLAALP